MFNKVLELVKEKERKMQKKDNDGRNTQEGTCAAKNRYKKNTKCYVCVTKLDIYLKTATSTTISQEILITTRKR